jgi:hypothetical protein
MRCPKVDIRITKAGAHFRFAPLTEAAEIWMDTKLCTLRDESGIIVAAQVYAWIVELAQAAKLQIEFALDVRSA